MEAYIGGEELLMMDGKHTIDEIYSLPEGERAELIQGELYRMATPTAVHQLLIGELYVAIANYVKQKKGACKAFLAPFAVLLHNDDSTYVEPDISVICDKERWDNQGCHGAPDWVIEIVSPSSKKLDYVIKLAEYQKAGVREYWIVDPEKEKVMVYDLAGEGFPAIYGFDSCIPVGIFSGNCEIDFREIKDYIRFIFEKE